MGKGGSTPSYQEPDPVPASSPPAASDNADVQRVKQEQKAKAKNASGWQSTLISGLGDNRLGDNGNGNKLLG